ncbi:FAD-binding oxidoreductase [Flavobacteriaceae bacterium]|uniref:FAD-binding oxidoreductase n=1 Tax=Candidatus Arcticimaribacter forsetii TaxID=2820661 RepID=UPI0020770FB0|nr:FAD-binding oxidoreductase [Candidatus Arcticimaribacter forsetii]MDA8698766.1 FAD-binding oxidoreductase [Flavobacteriaceae bacterium]MDB2325733.1 FAD-binding oxidoreductase [Flavobacteriaceae bacterium]MDB4620735.1 FAD-binding oxidoreductase [Flavobacteriaceae bacterium]MDB4674703.1 FAD-binding oxidoreductase [Flavobacteriaceae bacterium]MDB4738632.1 FAD-binding oxidoreductase [Flavobacteriaceae bacterium]
MDQNFIKSLTRIVGESNILHSGAEKERFTHIWKTDIPLEAKAVIFPSSTEEVSEIMKYCYSIKQEVIVHGGLTNLVGGTETESNQLVISLDKMNLIEEVDPQSKTITAQAGTILENMIDAAKEKNLLLPMSFGAKGSAHIGGVVSTNAGGLRVFRYGMTRQMVLGLEAVLPDGTIISSLKKIIKDNSGYDLKQLFIGSEGTLGIVTKVILRLSEAPTSRSSAIVGIDSYEQVIDLLKYLEKNLAGTLSGFELMWKNTYAAMTGDQSHLTAPISTEYNYYVFVESLGSQPKQDYERLENLIGNSLEMELIQDGVMMQSERELNSIWQIREDVSILAAQANFDQHFDISIPIPLIGELVDQAVKELNKLPFVERIFTFGHVADGNIHFIIGKKENNPKIIEAINQVIYRPLKEVGGSVSAEHGIGIHKKAYLATSRSKDEIDMMKTLKLTFDPLNILNPGRIF